MFAKIFDQIYDSSIVESPETRFTFMDFLVLADRNGVVDMTHEAISRRTNRPIEIIRRTISELEGPDPRSRTPDMNGARIFRLDEHRDWGWGIVNYDYFRGLASEEQRRAKTLQRVRKHRGKRTVTHCNASVTHVNASNAMQRQKQKQRQKEKAEGVPKHLNDVLVYAKQICLSDFEAQKFFDYFTSNGWKVSGRAPMRDWKASLRNWKRNARSSPPNGSYDKLSKQMKELLQ